MLDLLTGMPPAYKTASYEELKKRVLAVKEKMGDRLFIPGHHYQRDEVIQFADAAGDSLQLAQIASKQHQAEYIVFCGVHFMAETADILAADHQKVVLPDMRAGCSMADMADINQTERGWEQLQQLFGDTILPVTYVNSTAAIKSFVGKNGGATVTSSNALEVVKWAFSQKDRLFFLPDQHLGRNTAHDLGISLSDMAVWDPIQEKLEFEGELDNVKVILWKGHCSVHMNFRVDHIHRLRKEDPSVRIIVHPECTREVVALSDDAGSTKYIIDAISSAAKGSKWAIGTEMNLVNRLKQNFPEIKIQSLNPTMCPCLTMNRIDLPHLAWILESLEKGDVHNQIKVDKDTAYYAKEALDKMLQLT
ncbi:quinolinate synthase NadA [Jeotgalibacillus campisalis]|uniref:Quinolinate synthase n=1 Tax=Jeotgalibacillus campisalis TaxID=220754 RepID=A0A0C2VSN5_9BACL|nr:quinolinate synthase NadA [Jeotgalibacillus campisalis]KIL46988.1 quinolinate synthetase [Jeotgalibacillus campisalis]